MRGDRLDLDERAGRQGRHLERGARRRLVADVLRVDLVHAGEVVEVLEEDSRLDELVQTRARGLEDRPEVRKDLLRLLADRASHELRVTGLERHLAGDEYEPAGHDRLRVRSALKRRRRCLRSNDRLSHVSSLRLIGRTRSPARRRVP